jgi:hypothetical protein
MLRWKLFKFIFPNKIFLFNGKCMGIISAISARQMKITLIILLLVRFLMNFGENNLNLMKDMNIETTIFLNILYLDIIYMKKPI